MTKEENAMSNSDQRGKGDKTRVSVSVEKHTQKDGCTHDAAVHDHSRAFKQWQQKVKDDNWARISTELIDEGLPN